MPWRRYKPTDPRRHIVHLTTTLGRRGTALLIFGTIWVCTGISVLLAPPSGTYTLLALATAPRAIAWIATGVIAIMSAGRPQGHDAIGFLALYLMAAYRTIAYLAAAVIWLLPGGNEGNARGIVGALAWATVVLFVVLVAGWHEPNSPAKRGRS